MPLHVSDAQIDARFGSDVARALRAIKGAMEGRAVTPAVAMGLVKAHLLPLVPEAHHGIFHKRRAASWDGLFFIYADLGFCCGSSEHPLVDVMAAVRLIHGQTKVPPREFQFPTSVEVTYFFHVCGYLKVPTERWRRIAGHPHIDPFRFCTFCWRQPLPRRNLCAIHASSGQLEVLPEHSIETVHRSPAARYRAGARERMLFDTIANRLLTREVTEFHQSGFEAPFLIPATQVGDWLAERRPAVWQALSAWQSTLADDTVTATLLKLLQGPGAFPLPIRRHYEIVNRHYLQHPAIIWPMLLRAEALLRAQAERKQRWGGRRSGAGRRGGEARTGANSMAKVHSE